MNKKPTFRLQSFCIAVLLLLSSLTLIATADVQEESINGEHTIAIEQSTKSQFDFSVAVGDFQVESLTDDGQSFSRLHLAGGGHTADYGLPELPTLSFYVAVPQEAEARVSYTTQGYSDIGNYELYPAQPPKPETDYYVDPPFVQNSDFYQTNQFYPDSLVMTSSIIDVRGCRMVKITVFPYQYNAATNLLRKYHDFNVEVDFIGGTDVFVPERLRSIHFQPFYDAFIMNTDMIERAQPQNPMTQGRADRADLLIVVYDDFYEEILPLAEWRHQTGLETKVVKWSSIGSTAAQLRTYMTDAYNDWELPPSYLMIVGDADHVPVNYLNGNVGSDHWYVTFGTDDYFPDMHCGRISVDDEAQCTTYVNKVLDYCKDPYTGTDWFNRVLLAAKEEYGRYFVWGSETVYNYLDPLGYDVNRQYEGTTPPGSTQGCIDAIDNGVIIANHRDHGTSQNGGSSYTGWSSPRFTTDHIFNDIDNGRMYPVMFSLNCESGWFDGETDSYSGNYESIGEAGIRVPNGFIAVVAHTRVSYSGYNDEIGRGHYDAMFPDFDPTYPFAGGTNPYSTDVHRISQVMNYAKFWMYDKYVAPGGCSPYPWTPNEGTSELEFEMLHVHGDPTVEIWLAMPENLNVDHPPQIQYGPSDFTVNVKAQDNTPLENALVCLMQPNGIYAKGVTDSYGDVTLSIEVENPDEITLTATAHNHYYYQTQIMVGSSYPPDKPTVTGPTVGRPNKEYEYTAETTDPEGDQILYLFDWGDGTQSDWIGPVDSGTPVSTTHAWPDLGNYTMRVRAKDYDGATGYWCDPIIIQMDVPDLNVGIIDGGLLKVSANIRNYGIAEADDINYKIELDGGIILMGKETTGVVPTIGPGETATITSDMIFGFGATRIIVTADVPECSGYRSQGANIFLFFVSVKPGGG